MQKLPVEFKNVPVDIPHVHCSTSSSLKERKLSVWRTQYWQDNNLDAALACLVVQGENLRVSYVKTTNLLFLDLLTFLHGLKSGVSKSGEKRTIMTPNWTILRTTLQNEISYFNGRRAKLLPTDTELDNIFIAQIATLQYTIRLMDTLMNRERNNTEEKWEELKAWVLDVNCGEYEFRQTIEKMKELEEK